MIEDPKILSKMSVTSGLSEEAVRSEANTYSRRLIAKAPKQQSLRFVLVGASTALLDYLLLYLLTSRFGWNYLLSAAVGFMIGSTTNYLLSIRWVFIPGRFRREVEFSFFIMTSLAGLALNQLTMWLLVSFPRINYLYAKVFAIAIVAIWNFATKKRLVFYA